MSSDAGREDVKNDRERRLQPTVVQRQRSEVQRDQEHLPEEGYRQKSTFVMRLWKCRATCGLAGELSNLRASFDHGWGVAACLLRVENICSVRCDAHQD